MLKIFAAIALIGLTAPHLAEGQERELRARGVRWHMDKLRFFVEESAWLYADEFEAKEKILKEVTKITRKIEELAGEDESEADRRARATAQLYKGLAEYGTADIERVKRSFGKALELYEAVEIVHLDPVVTGRELMAEMDSLLQVPFLVVGFGQENPLPSHQLRWVPLESDEGDEAPYSLSSSTRFSLACLAKETGKRRFEVPVAPGLYRLETALGEGQIMVPIVFRIEPDGSIETIEGGGAPGVVTIRRMMDVVLEFDPPEFAYIRVLNADTQELVEGRGPGYRIGLGPDGMMEKFPPLPLGRYEIEEYIHQRQVEDIEGRRIAFSQTAEDSIRASMDGFEIYMVEEGSPVTMPLSKVPLLARMAPRLGPVAVAAIVYFLGFGNNGQFAR